MTGEPDQFAAMELLVQAVEYVAKTDREKAEAAKARRELTAARDRERVYRELVEAELALESLWQSASWKQIEQAKKRVQNALAECAKMGG